MNTKVLQLLKMDENQYEAMYMSAYLRWCESVSLNHLQVQMVAANSAVNNWYNVELQKCEAKFLDFAKNYEKSLLIDMQKLYDGCTEVMYSRNCPALIKKAIKNNHIYAKE